MGDPMKISNNFIISPFISSSKSLEFYVTNQWDLNFKKCLHLFECVLK